MDGAGPHGDGDLAPTGPDDSSDGKASRGGGRRVKPKGAASKAGRNLPAAIGVGVALGALVIATLFIQREVFLVVMCVAVLIAVWEVRSALAQGDISVPLVPVAVGAVSMVLGAFVGGPEALTVTLGLTLVAVLLWRVADGVSGALPDVVAGLFVTLYPCFLVGFASLLLAPPDGHWRIATFIIVTICSDIGGYAAGASFGKHPMAPSVSPKKSWEGFAGSALSCAVAGALCLHFLLDGPWLPGLLLGVLVAIGATLGDLMESTIKRDLGIKDMGNLLPGHGGLMDRLDSLVVTVPIVWVFLMVVVPA